MKLTIFQQAPQGGQKPATMAQIEHSAQDQSEKRYNIKINYSE